MKKIVTLLMSMVLIFALVSCGGGEKQSSDSATMTVQIEIDYPDESGISDVEDVKVDIAEGGSVMDAINAYAKANDCEILMDESSETPYITSIGGVAATDLAGWIYEVNDEVVMKSADACILNAGDEVSWSFESWAE